MIIAVDAMGGDYGPSVVCPGVLTACERHQDLTVVFVGDQEKIKPYVDASGAAGRVSVVHTLEAVGMDEHPSQAIRTKRRSSLRLAMEMVRSGEADGCLSAGNTGAIVAGGVLVVGRIRGIARPGLGVLLPTLKPTLLIDGGATVRCKPETLCQFARMGSAYMTSQMELNAPRVCLLSNGSEEIKGDDVIALAREALSADKTVNFGGYIEPNEVTFGKADVVVADGFTGNIMLKSFEGLVSYGMQLIKDEVLSGLLGKIGLGLCYFGARRLKAKLDYQRYGGSPLLGVDGVVVKAHGRSKAPAITSAMDAAVRTVQGDIVGVIRRRAGSDASDEADRTKERLEAE